MSHDTKETKEIDEVDPRDSTVIAYKLPIITNVKCTNIRAWSIPQLNDIDQRLRTVKSLIDKPYAVNPKLWDTITKQLEVSFHISKKIRQILPLANNTVAKLVELFNHFKTDIFPPSSVPGKFVHFDNAAMPGIFPYTTKYYLEAFHPHLNYQWYASSLIESTSQDERPLRDEYNLWKNYPNNWLMSKTHNGDVMNINVQNHFKAMIGGQVDLYTSDIGFDVSLDYNEQETLQSPANLGQVISGLITLKVGGTLITKQYTFMTPFTISLMGLLTTLFETVYITKPMASKPDNSETYVVCIKFKGITSEMESLLFRELSVAATLNPKTPQEIIQLKPLIQKSCISTDFINTIVKANNHISKNTIDKIKANLQLFEQQKNLKIPDMCDQVDHWFRINPMPAISHSKLLQTSRPPNRNPNRHRCT